MGKILSVHSFRGGTGKSNITANLAVACAMYGDARVGVIDTDIQSPGVHVIFGLGGKKLQHPLNQYLQGQCKIEEVAVDVTKSLKLEKGQLFMFPAALEASEITKILREGYEVSMLSEGFNQIIDNMNLDYLLIDTHPGLNEETFLSIAVSDGLFVVMRPDSQDYLGTSVTLEIAKKLDVPNIYMIINKLLPKYDVASVKKEVEKTYKIPVAGIIKFYEELADTASKEVFITIHPEHELTGIFKEIYEIARQI
ncbi:MAG: MinD/ParA family ATP-binding protein [Candidatus Helarchaeota archaeon]